LWTKGHPVSPYDSLPYQRHPERELRAAKDKVTTRGMEGSMVDTVHAE
jgi:hypothetical protein